MLGGTAYGIRPVGALFTFAGGAGGPTTHTGGGPATMSIDMVGGGAALRTGGGAASFALDSAGGGAVVRSGGAALTISILMVGGGEKQGPGYRPTIRTPAVEVRKNYRAEAVRVARVVRAPYTATVRKTFRAEPCKL